MVVTGWLKLYRHPRQESIGKRIKAVNLFADNKGEPIYYIVSLQPSGFVIVPADDRVEPIIGFALEGVYDPAPHNPLAALVRQDLNRRVTSVRNISREGTTFNITPLNKARAKWLQLTNMAQEIDSQQVGTLGASVISDIRVHPLIQSAWDQGLVCQDYCYNYYTPHHYYCGCVAAAMAQLMRFHEHPPIDTGVGVLPFSIKVDDVVQTAYTRGGDGSGGPYNWDLMVLDPNCSITEPQRQALGTLCYDAGVSVNMNYSNNISFTD
ncbi:MAG: hypothetical protein AMJ79_15410, partial [Phycisphaerae bacterium SM23_30]